MIHSLVGFPIRGAIWYQGESNHGEGMLYLEKKKALIGGWRELWGQGDFPFYYAQIAPYKYGNEDPAILAKFWEAQAACQSIPKTGMVTLPLARRCLPSITGLSLRAQISVSAMVPMQPTGPLPETRQPTLQSDCASL